MHVVFAGFFSCVCVCVCVFFSAGCGREALLATPVVPYDFAGAVC